MITPPTFIDRKKRSPRDQGEREGEDLPGRHPDGPRAQLPQQTALAQDLERDQDRHAEPRDARGYVADREERDRRVGDRQRQHDRESQERREEVLPEEDRAGPTEDGEQRDEDLVQRVQGT